MTPDLDLAQVGLSKEEGPSFDEPWQAQAFSIVVQLSKVGAFTWKEWVDVFSTEIREHPAGSRESTNTAYYRQWMAALETIVAQRGLATSEDVETRKEMWRQAYIHTPHGEPVRLQNACCAPAHSHEHVAMRTPITISPAR
ncbi:nitrile hydratase accessory protein [Paraburkholderia dilworthii]|uniref:nitrile hydratase accessory protein n=1 Tax=Paraburkholderia dilworthii TaxID=948106 RepID=UPI0004874C14|nr:nitrile hydratase accessory protein [Paraburkholderia dilworthii]